MSVRFVQFGKELLIFKIKLWDIKICFNVPYGYELIISIICTLHQQILKKRPQKSINNLGIASGFLLPKDDISNIGGVVVLSSGI